MIDLTNGLSEAKMIQPFNDRKLIAAILIKHGGSLTLQKDDLIRVPPNYSIEQTENKITGAICLNIRYRT